MIKMRVLLMNPAKGEATELIDWFQTMHCAVEAVYDRTALSRILGKKAIDVVLYNASELTDFAMISYINSSYPGINVIVSMDSSFCAAIENVRTCAFRVMKKPYKLSNLLESMQSATETK